MDRIEIPMVDFLEEVKEFFKEDSLMSVILKDVKLGCSSEDLFYIFVFPLRYGSFSEYIQATLQLYFDDNNSDNEFDIKFCSGHKYVCINCDQDE